MCYAGNLGPKGFLDEAEKVEDILCEMDTERMKGKTWNETEKQTYEVLRNYQYLLRFGLGVTKEQAMEALFTKGLNELVTKILWNKTSPENMH